MGFVGWRLGVISVSVIFFQRPNDTVLPSNMIFFFNLLF